MFKWEKVFNSKPVGLMLTLVLAVVMLSLVPVTLAGVGVGSNTPEQSDIGTTISPNGVELPNGEAVITPQLINTGLSTDALSTQEVALMSKVQTTGVVDVIVGLNGNYYLPGTLSAQDAQAQQQSLNTMRNDILGTLGTPNVQVLAESTTWSIPFMAVSVDQAGLLALLNSPYITSVQENLDAQVMLSTSVPVIRAPQVWALNYRGNGQTIAVIDTGVERTHAFVTGRVVSEACFSAGGSGVTSLCPNNATSQTGEGAASPAKCESLNKFVDCFHGMHVAGIAAGSNGPAGAPSGVAPAANIMAINVASAPTSTTATQVTMKFADILSGLNFVYTNRNTYSIAAVNLSLGLGGLPFTDAASCDAYYPSFTTAFNNLRAAGIAPVISSGNDGFVNGQSWPSCITSVVSVGATSDADAVANFSNRSALLDLFAPGVSITSSAPVNGYCDKAGGGAVDGYCTAEGTSMAAPHVAGAFALLRQASPGASVDTLVNFMRNTGKPITIAAGTVPRVDVLSAIQTMGSTPTNTNLIANSTFNTNLNGWTYWNLTADNAAGYFRMARNVGTPDGGFYTNVPYSFSAGSPLELKFNLGNNSPNGKAIQVFLRNPNENDYTLTCQWSIPPGQFPDSVYTMQAIVPRNWSSVNVQAFIVPADGQMALLVDNMTLQYRPSLSVPGGLRCLYDAPANRNLIYNSDFSQGGNGWGIFFANKTTFANNRMNIYREANEGVASGSGGGFWQQIASPLRQGSVVEWFVQVGNASNSPKNFKMYMHAVGAPGNQYGGCQLLNIPANSSAVFYRMQTVAATDMTTIVLQGFVEPDDNSPSLTIDNITFQYRPDLAAGTSCTAQAPGAADALMAQGMQMMPIENGVVGLPVAPDFATPPTSPEDGSAPTPELPEGITIDPIVPDVPTAEVPPGLIIEPVAPESEEATPELPPGVNVVPVAPEAGS